jgi:hypothetical protein
LIWRVVEFGICAGGGHQAEKASDEADQRAEDRVHGRSIDGRVKRLRKGS